MSAAALALLPYLVVVADAPSPPARPRQTADNPCVEASAKGYAVHDRDGCKGITLTRVKSSLGAMRWNGDEKSVWVESLEVDWSLDLSMSVSKRYEEGGCAYKAVVAHETGHWNDSLDAQRAGLDGFEDDLVALRLPTKDHPAPVPPARRKKYIREKGALVSKAFRDREARFDRQVRAALARRDSPAAYRRFLDACPRRDWAAKSR